MGYVGTITGIVFALAAATCAAMDARAQGGEAPPATSPEQASKLEVVIDKAKVDLKEHRLEVKMNHVAAKVTIKVLDETGAVLADQEHPFAGVAAGTTLVVTWSPSSDATVGRIEVFGYDEDGAYKGIAITPWAISIPHEDVNFRRDSADIDEPEKSKLEASFAKINEAIGAHKDLGRISLFIAGHTDSVGTPAHNLQLSRARAQTIAGWFRKRGLKIPIAFEGFGESALLVKTADEVDEPRNRRVDYIRRRRHARAPPRGPSCRRRDCYRPDGHHPRVPPRAVTTGITLLAHNAIIQPARAHQCSLEPAGGPEARE